MIVDAASSEPAGHFGLRLDRLGGRPFLVAIAVLNAMTGTAAAAVLIPTTFGGDVDIFRRGSIGVGEGSIAPGFLYAPLFGLLATPLTWPPFEVAATVVSLAGLAVLLLGVALETRGRATIDRALVAVAAVTFLPVVYELITGQVTLFIAAAIYPLRDRDGWRRGIAHGVVMGLIPKPLLVPLLLWMLLYRRRASVAAVAVALGVTIVGVALLGPDLYRGWAAALVGTGQITRNGNLALNALEPPWLAGCLWLASAAAGLLIIARLEAAGFVAALVVAMLVQPFTLTYAASILLLAVRPALKLMPRATRWLSLAGNPAVLAGFVPWMLAGLAACALKVWEQGPDGPSEPA